MSKNKKYEDAKARIIEVVKEHPLETAGVVIAAIAATAKLIDSVVAAQNSATWKREVERRRSKNEDR